MNTHGNSLPQSFYTALIHLSYKESCSFSAFMPYSKATSSDLENQNKLGRKYNPGRPLCVSDRQRILFLYEKGYKISHIARIIGVTHSCVSKIMSRYRRTGTVTPKCQHRVDLEESLVISENSFSQGLRTSSPTERSNERVKFTDTSIMADFTRRDKENMKETDTVENNKIPVSSAYSIDRTRPLVAEEHYFVRTKRGFSGVVKTPDLLRVQLLA